MAEAEATEPAKAGRIGPWMYGLVVGLSSLFALIVPLLWFGSAGHDDSHITYWSAHQLASTGSITNFNGEAVEQSSALATTVVLALLHLLLPFVSLPTLGTALSLLAFALVVPIAATLADRLRPGAGIYAAPLVATEPMVAYWSSSGMETSLAALAWVWLPLCLDDVAEGLSRRRLVALAIASLLAASVRPESAHVLLAMLVGVGVAMLLGRRRAEDRPALRRMAMAASAPIFAVALVIGYRLLAFASWLPQPVAAKTGGPRHLDEGWKYLREDAIGAVPTLAIACLAVVLLLIGWVRRRGGPRPVWPVLALLGAGPLFIVGSGGDWMEAGRFLVPWLPLAAVVAATAWAALARLLDGGGGESKSGRSRVRRVLAWIPAGLVALVAANQFQAWSRLAAEESEGRPLWDTIAMRDWLGSEWPGYPLLEYGNSAHTRDIFLLAELDPLVTAVRERVGPDQAIVIASGQAGMVPFYLFRAHEGLYFVDFNTLATKQVNPCVPEAAQHHLKIGLHFDLRAFHVHRERIAATCGVGLPDIVYDSGSNAAKVTRGLPYVVIHDHPPRVVPHGKFGNEDIAQGWVAVRKDHATALGLRPARRKPLALPPRP